MISVPKVQIRDRNGWVKSIPVKFAELNRILVVKLDHIGDWVLATPFLRNLRANAPQAFIDVIVNEAVLPLAVRCSAIDRAAAIRRRTHGFSFCGETKEPAVSLESDYDLGRFDLSIVPRWDVDFDGAGEIASGSGAPLVIGFSDLCTARKRVLNSGCDRFYTHVLDDTRVVHEVEHNLALLAAMNSRIADRRAVIESTSLDIVGAKKLLSSVCRRRPLLAIAPFASEPKRCIPLDLTAELVASLRGMFGAAVIVGGPEDCELGTRLARRLGSDTISIVGQAGLADIVAAIRCCDAMIAVDSGPAHIAAAVGTPVAVFACHVRGGAPDHENSPVRFAPWGEAAKTLVLQPDHAVSPCRDHCDVGEPHCILESVRAGREKLYRFHRRAVEADSETMVAW